MIRNFFIAVGVWGTLAIACAQALTTITEDFSDDPFWSTLNNTAVNDNYGYSPNTNHAGGAAGEAGGLFGRHDAFDSFYADTDLGGWLSATDVLHSSGKISVDASLSPQFPMNIAFFDSTKPDKGGNALRINIQSGGQFMLWLRLKIGKNLQSPVTSGLVTGDYNWEMNWDPAGNGGLGSGTVTFFGASPGTPASVSATLDIPMRNEFGNPEWLAEPIFFNAFGLQNHDAEATTGGQYRVYMDDVTYSAVSAPATTSSWGLIGSDTWVNSRNWDPGEVPYGDDRGAVFGDSITQDSTVLVDREITVKSIQFDNASHDYAVAGTGMIKLDAASGSASIAVLQGTHEMQARTQLMAPTTVSTNSGGSLEFDGIVEFNGFTMQIAPDSNVRIQNLGDIPDSGGVNNAGMLSGSGRINGDLTNQSGGTVAPGNSAGTLRVDGAFMQHSAASLAIELGGEAAGRFDVLMVNGAASLDGSLAVSLIDGFSPNGDEDFTVLTATGGIVDHGLSLGGPAGDSFYFNIVGSSLVLSAGLQGDYNDDGIVDAADYTVWRNTMGSTVDLRADGNANQQIDVGDYVAWKTNYGNTLPGGSGGLAAASAAVPEPGGLATVAIALVSLTMLSGRQITSNWATVFVGNLARLIIAVVAALVALPAANAELIGNNFNSDPQWEGNDNILPGGDPAKKRDDLNHYGYFPDTSNAFGSPGEIGGYFGTATIDSYYADTTLGGSIGGSFPLQQTLHASGRMMINSGHSPTWNMNIGFFDSTVYSSSMTGPQGGRGGDAVRLSIIELTPNFRMRLEIRQQGNAYEGPIFDGPNAILDGMYSWSMDYNPIGGAGGKGRLSMNLQGPSTVSSFVDVDEFGKNIPMNLNAFGFTNYDSETNRPLLNKHYTFLDDITYTTNETADPIVAWARSGHGHWADASSWRSTARTDGAGFVPHGNDRKSIFGSGITQDAIVLVDDNVSVREIDFNNASFGYTIAGTGAVTLDHDSGGDATIEVLAGNHGFQAETHLAVDAVVDAAAGTQLDFNNTVYLNGHILALMGDGTVNFNNAIDTGPGGLVINSGGMGGLGTILGDLMSIGILSVTTSELSGGGGLSVEGTAEVGGLVDVLVPNGAKLARGDIFSVLSASRIVDRGLQLSPEDTARFRLSVSQTQIVVQFIVPEPNAGATLLIAFICLTWSDRFGARWQRRAECR